MKFRRFDFVQLENNSNKVTASVAENAAVVSVKDAIAFNVAQSEYIFVPDKETNDTFKGATLERRIREINGDDKNDYLAILADGRKIFNLRAYNGKDNILPPLAGIPADKVEIGYCTQDGAIVTELRKNISGDVVQVPILYVREK